MDTSGHLQNLEHRAGIEPAYTGFADLRVSHFATGAWTVVRVQLSVISLDPANDEQMKSNN
jgi:hypothetical protein